MANLDVSLGGLESSNPIIDIDILEINSSSPNIEQIQAWEDFEKFKFGPLHKIEPNWELAKIKIKGSIDKKSTANKAIAIIHCRWTNYYEVCELKFIEEKNGRIVFNSDLFISRNNFSSKIVIKIKFLSEHITKGISPEFNIQSDTREGVEIGNSLFNWAEGKFDDKDLIKDEEWYDALEELKAFKVMSSTVFPDDESETTTIIVNTYFPVLEDFFVPDLKEINNLLYVFMMIVMTSGPYLNICSYITIALSQIEIAKREEENLDESDFGDTLMNEISQSNLKFPIEVVNFISGLIFPTKNISPEVRLFKWWKLSEPNSFFRLSERFQLSYQNYININKSLSYLKKASEELEKDTSTDSDEVDED